MPEPTCPLCHPEAPRIRGDLGAIRILADGDPLDSRGALIVPRRHFAHWHLADAAEKQTLLAAIDRALEFLHRNHPEESFHVGWNEGPVPGPTTPHFFIRIGPDRDRDAPQAGRLRDTAELALPHTEGLVSGESDPLLPHLSPCFARAARVDIAVAFVMRRGVDLLRAHLDDLLAWRTPPGRLRLLTGDYLGATDPDGLEALLDLPGNRALRVFEAADRSFHPKSYLFHFADGRGIAFVGSSNLSQTALQTGIEWNYRIVRSTDRAGFASIANGFERLFAHAATRELTHEWIDAYRRRRRPQSPTITGVAQETAPEPPAPHAFQEAALTALRATRADGNTAGLVVLATGLGKTWLAAFDSVDFPRVLFVAHRDEILDQAITTFRRIRPAAALGKFTGSEKVPEAEVLFASVQTLARATHLRSFPPDQFDYIVVDEFHHAAARTYRALIDHFEPRFLLGLTATPERTDGADLLALCGRNLVYRADLGQGIREGHLAPFHYLGVPDDVDYAQIPWRSSRFDEVALTEALATHERAQNAFEHFERYAGKQALGFCCSQRHADFMAEWFNAHGKHAAAVHSGATSAPRTLTMEALKNGDLDIVFSVDMFNEGVDVPTIDTVLMLRPTESRILWLQQLGRGLRKAEGKQRLQVIDYIGNHRVFLEKPRALFGALLGWGDSPEALRQALDRLRRGDLDLPPGCEVTYDLVETLLDELLKPAPGAERLRASYADFRERHGRRPAPTELRETVALSQQILRRSFDSWFGLVRTMADLTADEEVVLRELGEFLEHLETATKDQILELLVLQALLAADALPGGLAVRELASRLQRIADRSPLLRAEVQRGIATHGSAEALLRAGPLKTWSSSGFFELADDALGACFEVRAELRETFRQMARELVDWRLAESIDRRSTDSFQCTVYSNQRHPILRLPDRRSFPGLPEGTVPLTADGRRFEAHFAKMAIDKITGADGETNELPGLLRGWFGPEAGGPGRSETVVCERAVDGYRMRPLRRQLSGKLKVHDERGQPLDATFRVEQTGDTVSVVFFSRGGTKGSSEERNSQYTQGLEVLLARMGRLGLLLEEVLLDTGKVTDILSTDERRLEIEGLAYPIELAETAEFGMLRRRLGKAQARAGRKPGAKGSGNSTKQVRLVVAVPTGLDTEALPDLLSHSGPGRTTGKET